MDVPLKTVLLAGFNTIFDALPFVAVIFMPIPFMTLRRLPSLGRFITSFAPVSVFFATIVVEPPPSRFIALYMPLFMRISDNSASDTPMLSA